MKTILYNKLDNRIIKDWLFLWESLPCANYCNSPYWFLSVLENFKYKNIVIVAVYEDDQLLAIIGLVKEKKFGVNFYTMPPGDFVYGIPFLIDFSNKRLVKTFINKLLSLGNIFFINIPEQLVASIKGNISQMNVLPGSLNFYFTIERDNRGEVIMLNRKKLTHRVKNIEERFKLKTYTGDNLNALEIVFVIDNQSRKQVRGYNTFSNNIIKKFYRSLSNHFKNRFLIFILYFDGKPIAYRLGFIVGETYYGSQTAFLKEYIKYWPGSVLLVKVTDYLGDNGIKIYDFGSGDNYSKRSFANKYKILNQIIISNNFLIRNYIKTIYFIRSILFKQVEKRVRIYTIYRTIINTFGN